MPALCSYSTYLKLISMPLVTKLLPAAPAQSLPVVYPHIRISPYGVVALATSERAGVLLHKPKPGSTIMEVGERYEDDGYTWDHFGWTRPVGDTTIVFSQ